VDIKSLADTVPDRYDAVVVGASIHMGKHDKHVVKFVQKNRDTLERLPSAFFSVSLAAYGDTHEARRTSRATSDSTRRATTSTPSGTR
jgi:menaquinone-dependent protoporphyrinogen oxidase